MGTTTMSQLPKRHCMVVHAYYPVGETRVQREALALIDQGYKVDVICLRAVGDKAVAEEDGVHIYRLPVKRHKGRGLIVQFLEYVMFLFFSFGKLSFLHRRHQYSTVQVHNLPDFLVFAALGPKLSSARIILDLHDLMPEFFAAKISKDMDNWLVRLVIWQEQLSCRFADHVITVTESWRRRLIERGVPPGKVSVVMNVADPRIFQRHMNGKQPFGNGRGFKLIYHGTFTHRYGVDLIIQAVEMVRPQIPDIHLSLLGSGEYREKLMMLTRALALEDHVTFSEGTIHANQLPQLIQQANVGIVPNRSNIFTDGLLPTKLMEYVALGVPVIAARTPTISAYFDDSMVEFFQPGDVNDLADSIVSLHEDQERQSRLAKNAEKFNEEYNWKEIATNYVSLVRELNGETTK